MLEDCIRVDEGYGFSISVSSYLVGGGDRAFDVLFFIYKMFYTNLLF